MIFEFDPIKSAANKAKQGIDFVEAQALWLDERRLDVPALITDEPRFLILAMIGSKHWTAVYTYRGDAVRSISVRRARQKEIEHYESD